MTRHVPSKPLSLEAQTQPTETAWTNNTKESGKVNGWGDPFYIDCIYTHTHTRFKLFIT